MQDRAFGIDGLAMAVRCASRVKAASELELGLGREMALILEHKDLVLEQSIVNDFDFGI